MNTKNHKVIVYSTQNPPSPVDNTTQKQRYRGITDDTTVEKITNNMGHDMNDPNIKSAYE